MVSFDGSNESVDISKSSPSVWRRLGTRAKRIAGCICVGLVLNHLPIQPPAEHPGQEHRPCIAVVCIVVDDN